MNREFSEVQRVFLETVGKKRARLEELAQLPLGERFLHHTILGTPNSLRSSIPYTIIKYGLLTGEERKAKPDTNNRTSNTWFSDSSPVYLMPDSYNSFRVGSEGIQMMTLIVDPNILKTKKHYKTTKDSRDLFDAYFGEVGVSSSIEPEHILGAIVSGEGHNTLLELQTELKEDPKELEREDKKMYNAHDGKFGEGTIREVNKDNHILGEDRFYRGLVWGMNDFPQNSFPVFSGFSSSHFPYMSGASWSGEEANENNEIPFEYYLAGQIFPLTPEAYAGQAFRDIAEKQGVSPRDFGVGIRCGKGLVTPERALGRRISEEERETLRRLSPQFK